MLQGFKDFLFRGNIVDLAVAVVIGTAFTALVTNFSENFINPLLASLGGADAAEGLGFRILSDNPATFINIGSFITAIITFVITAAVVYFLVVLPSKTLLEKLNQGEVEEPEGPSEDIQLLREIRDSLKANNGGL